MRKIFATLVITIFAQAAVADVCYCQAVFKKKECWDLGGGIKDCMPDRWRWHGVVENNGQAYVVTSDLNDEDSCISALTREAPGCHRVESRQ